MTVSELKDILEIYLDKVGDDVIECGVSFEESIITYPVIALQATIIEGNPICFLEMDMLQLEQERE